MQDKLKYGQSQYQGRVTIQRGVFGVKRQVFPLTKEQIIERIENSDYPISGFPIGSIGKRYDLSDVDQANILSQTVHVLHVDENVVRFDYFYYIVRKDDDGERVLCRLYSKD